MGSKQPKQQTATPPRAPWAPDQAAREAQRLDAGHGVLAPEFEMPEKMPEGKVHPAAVVALILLAALVLAITWYAVTHVVLTLVAGVALWLMVHISSRYLRRDPRR
jgi:hypothetical protein